MAEAALTDQVQPEKDPRKLDDVMLAMDVVDTLRHDQQMLARDLSKPEREQDLINRLREIYKSQGIDVPDRILREGVKALEDERFAYTPYKPGFFARAYVNRGRWGKPLLALMALFGFIGAFYYGGVVYPQKLQARQAQQDLQRIGRELQDLHQGALSLAATQPLKEKVEALYQDAGAAIEDGDVRAAKKLEDSLKTLKYDLAQNYTVRIVSRPGENSGVFRLNDKSPGARNYYLIVEGVRADGEVVPVNITSEENQKTRRVKKWGIRVPERVYQSVAADKRDDQIIQKAIVGHKKRGVLKPEYTIPTLGGQITEW